ncbi:hypothetical protein [[Eubacterium] hominis]|uniref:hypothetical protein n=1 Tax=[Eubacterium] hominis TaxID=2764325 RepID=UPI003A4DEE93
MEKRRLAMNMLWICIDQGDDVTLSGRFYSHADHQIHEFYDFDQLILQADALFDRIDFPQSFQSKRSFRQEPKKEDFLTARAHMKEVKEEDIKWKGSLFTGVILVSTRQFSNWQGSVMDDQFKKIADFYGVVELMKVLTQMIQNNK